MRSLSFVLLSLVLTATAGCAAAPTAALPTAPQAPVQTTQVAPPPAHDPVAVAKQILETGGGVRWLEPPTPVLAQQMSYQQAKQLVPVLARGSDQVWPDETSIWLVIFRGQWTVAPFDPSQPPPQPVTYQGCSMVLFTAADNSLIAIGDTTCP